MKASAKGSHPFAMTWRVSVSEKRNSSFDGCFGADRRKVHRPGFFAKGRFDIRSCAERRSGDKRRAKCVRVGKWKCVRLKGSKIANFLNEQKESSDRRVPMVGE